VRNAAWPRHHGSKLVTDARAYPDRPFLAASAAIIRDGRALIVRRTRLPASGVYTLPGGVVEAGETLIEAVTREVREETGLEIEPATLAAYREVILRDDDNKVSRHFVVLSFAARWLSGEVQLNDELDDARWLRPAEIAGLKTTEGLSEIVATAFERLGVSPASASEASGGRGTG
jgi:ADP-ribose pyrophosphatase YjhB (NUDIX family)